MRSAGAPPRGNSGGGLSAALPRSLSPLPRRISSGDLWAQRPRVVAYRSVACCLIIQEVISNHEKQSKLNKLNTVMGRTSVKWALRS